jgi:integral membrane protein (TIGR01906 family)
VEKKDERHLGFVIFLTILTMIWLFGASFRVLLVAPVTSLLAENTVNDALSSFDHSQLVEVAKTGRAFVAGDRDAVLLEGDDARTSFTPDVVSHMEDVRYVLQGVQIAVLVITALWAAVLLIPGRRMGWATIGSGLFFGGIAAVVVALLFALTGGINFDALFTGMHRVFFSEGTWTFAEDSLLICAYPLAFWIGMGIAWAVVLVFLSALVATVGFLIGRMVPETPVALPRASRAD